MGKPYSRRLKADGNPLVVVDAVSRIVAAGSWLHQQEAELQAKEGTEGHELSEWQLDVRGGLNWMKQMWRRGAGPGQLLLSCPKLRC